MTGFRTTAQRAGLALALTGALVATASAASATIVDRATFSFAEDETFGDCGFDIHLVGQVDGKAHIREVKQSGGQAFNLHQLLTIHETYTNVETGKWFTFDTHELLAEQKATHVEGTIWRWRVIEAGVPFVITDQSGRVVLRDRGVIHYDEVADTLGDGQVGAIVLSFEPVRVSGPHPAFESGFDFCAMAEQLTS